MSAIEELFAPVRKAGWLVNNLFQLESGTWRCSLRSNVAQHPRVAYEFGDGATPEQAVEEAMAKAGLGLGKPMKPQVYRMVSEPSRKIEAKTGMDLLKTLGL